jgi:hypothetical protein
VRYCSLARSAWDSAPEEPSSRVRSDSRKRAHHSVWHDEPSLGNTAHIFDEKYLCGWLRLIIPCPTGRFSLGGDISQALRARLRSCCPSGTKYILRTEA